ncbi:cytochrome P450 [Exophiala viscosa]|uniref:cytochrome P450 n=1 Tax=Exophiala viscosa TaxID=2486360 RepID=UPI002198258F|nr:cytochrome P450 [Exophiala viscosa]
MMLSLSSAQLGDLAAVSSKLILLSILLVPLGLLSLYLHNTPSTWKDSRRKNLPPGPKGYPFIGNLLDLADSELVRAKAIDWHQRFGDIFYTKIGGTDYIWLSSPKAVKDCLDKKSNIYSSRSPAPFAQDVASGGKRQLFMNYGPAWRNLRKSSHALLNANSAIKYQPIQDFESKQLMVELIDSPEKFYQHNRRYSASVVMLLTYGYRLPKWDHPLVKQIYTVLDNLTEMTAPGAHAVDSFPSLAKLPQQLLGNWRSHAEKVFAYDSQVYMGLWEALKKGVDDGSVAECFCKDYYLADPKKHGIDDLQAAYMCGGLVEAGSETTSTTLNNFVLAMLLFPEATAKAQEEIDRVIGSSRMPTWEDEADLPYVRALVKETLRWRAVNKFGMPHYTTDDDWYEGYFIPKNSVVMLNWWAIHMNSELYKDPETFDPSRYLDKPLSAAEYINVNDPYERDHFTYGAGRRVCPGVHVAERSLYINIARTLWGFKITKPIGADGKPIEPDTTMIRGFLSVPRPFQADFTVRSPSHAATIRKTFEAAEKEGINIQRSRLN